MNDLITIKTNICHGQPCFIGTRIMIYLVLEMLEAGESIEQILKAYPALTNAHITAALHYAAETIKTNEFVPFAKAS